MQFPAVDMSVKPEVDGFFDPVSNTISYIVKYPASDACAIIDSVLDIDYAAGRIPYNSANRLIDAITARALTLAPNGSATRSLDMSAQSRSSDVT